MRGVTSHDVVVLVVCSGWDGDQISLWLFGFDLCRKIKVRTTTFRTLVNVWTSANYSPNGKVLITKKKWEETYLLKQQIPQLFGRNIRSFTHNKYYKVYECLVFLLYTSKTLRWILLHNHYVNHVLLVDGCYKLLNGDN